MLRDTHIVSGRLYEEVSYLERPCHPVGDVVQVRTSSPCWDSLTGRAMLSYSIYLGSTPSPSSSSLLVMLAFVRLAHHSTAISAREPAGCIRCFSDVGFAAMMRRGSIYVDVAQWGRAAPKWYVAGSSPAIGRCLCSKGHGADTPERRGRRAGVAQLAERGFCKSHVAGSTPVTSSTHLLYGVGIASHSCWWFACTVLSVCICR